MTTDARVTGRVLVVGKRARILSELAAALAGIGVEAQIETSVPRARRLADGPPVDVLAVGRAIKPDDRDALASALRRANPRLRVVDGLAPITPLLVAQVEEALTSPGRDARIVGAATFEAVHMQIVLTMRRAADARVVLHRLDVLYRAHQLEVFQGRLEQGRNTVPVPRRVGRGERYLVVRAAGETSVHTLAE